MPTLSLWNQIEYQGRVNGLLQNRGVTTLPSGFGFLTPDELEQLTQAHEAGTTPAAFVETILLARRAIPRRTPIIPIDTDGGLSLRDSKALGNVEANYSGARMADHARSQLASGREDV